MKLSVITCTCREKPLFLNMARALAVNAFKNPNVDIEWIVVDEKLWYGDAQERIDEILEGLGTLKDRIQVIHVAPKQSKWRGPSIERALPDQAGARNTGLALASGDYVLFLDDCTLLGGLLFEDLFRVAPKGFRANVLNLKGASTFRMPEDADIMIREKKDKPKETKGTTIANACFGAPKAAFEKVCGFDESYSGEQGKEDADIGVRLERSGVKFMTSLTGWAYRPIDTCLPEEVTRVKEVLRGHKNKVLFSKLVEDRTRFLPISHQQSLADLKASLVKTNSEQLIESNEAVKAAVEEYSSPVALN